MLDGSTKVCYNRHIATAKRKKKMAQAIQLENGLTLVQDDYETAYYYNDGEFVFTGMQDSGECSINGEQYCYSIDETGTMNIFGDSAEAVYSVADAYSADKMYAFIKSVLV
jgi:hypothetical protein